MKKKYIIMGILAIGAVLLIANYQNIIKSVIPPIPEIVSSKADGTSSKLFNYSMKVFGDVRNTGGDGYIVVEATAHQNEKVWTKTQQIYFSAYETKPFELIFDEVKFFKNEPSYDVKAYALGSSSY